jgi:hypothetical protein
MLHGLLVNELFGRFSDGDYYFAVVCAGDTSVPIKGRFPMTFS